MGCNCTAVKDVVSQRITTNYYPGTCTYFLTLKGCQQLMPHGPIGFTQVQGHQFCQLKSRNEYYQVQIPLLDSNECPSHLKKCGSYRSQYCIPIEEMCPVTDLKLIKYAELDSHESGDGDEVFEWSSEYAFVVRRSAPE
jgi:hypothetical protein